MKSWIFLFAALFLSSAALAQTGTQPAAPIVSVLNLSRDLNLSSERAWRKLLHFEKNSLGLMRSQISDPAFFLSPEGAKSPQKELEATLKSFTSDPSVFATRTDKGLTDHSQHPICRFPARLKYLKSKLPAAHGFWNSLPEVQCTYQNIYLKAVDTHSVSFVFSSYYSDSPGSAFGHTFFRLNKKPVAGQKRQELLDYGTGYAANVTVTNPALYAIFGLLGGFTGSWMNLPYYYKVREYNDYEARDLWSYDLNLSPDEVEMLVLHLWEVGPHYYTYYFFTQNCAYHMLTLLEAAAPRLDLTGEVPLYVIPADSMKALFEIPGLVGNISFRPSIRKTFLARSQNLNPQQAAHFQTYAKTGQWPADFASWPETDKASFIDTALDLQDLRHPESLLKTDSESFRRKEELLNRRAAIDVISHEPEIPVPASERPENSHGSSRWGLRYDQSGEGLRQGFFEYRFALHDLLDPQDGLPGNSQLEFFNFKFQIKPGELQLRELQIFQVFNLNPIRYFERKPSWGVKLGLQSLPDCGEREHCLAGGMQFQYGYSLDLDGWQPWLMASGNLRYGEGLKDSRSYLAPGAEAGLLKRFGLRQAALARYLHEWPVDRDSRSDWEIQYRWSPSIHDSYGLSLRNSFGGILYYHYF